MSLKAMIAVWDESQHKGSKLLLMLAIADNADEDNYNAWPKIETLAKKCRLTERYIQMMLDEMSISIEDARELITAESPVEKEIVIYPQAGPHRENVFHLNIGKGRSILQGEPRFRVKPAPKEGEAGFIKRVKRASQEGEAGFKKNGHEASTQQAAHDPNSHRTINANDHIEPLPENIAVLHETRDGSVLSLTRKDTAILSDDGQSEKDRSTAVSQESVANGSTTTTTRKKKEPFPADSDAVKLALWFRDKIVKTHPDAIAPEGDWQSKDIQKWAQQFAVMLKKLDKIKICQAIDNAYKDSWWRDKIMSPHDLSKNDYSNYNRCLVLEPSSAKPTGPIARYEPPRKTFTYYEDALNEGSGTR